MHGLAVMLSVATWIPLKNIDKIKHLLSNQNRLLLKQEW